MYIKNYPRPQLVRTDWSLLNGSWDFAFDDKNVGEKQKWYDELPKDNLLQINVPFSYETKLSGINDQTAHKVVWYQRNVDISKGKAQKENKRIIINFEGVDYDAKVWVNGRLAGSHRGAYARFSFDITDLSVEGANTITVKAEDSYDISQPRGKQRWKDESFACWYVQTTGIWKSVWLEYTGSTYINQLKITPILFEKKVIVEVNVAGEEVKGSMLNAKVTFNDELINAASAMISNKYCRLEIDLERQDLFEWGVYAWSPAYPSLYDMELAVLSEDGVEDKVYSYFGMRDIAVDGANVLLNGEPIYQKLILDQGYWKDSHLTPPDEEALIKDIDAVLAMGFNGVRKHQKVEDERFLYWCDVKGLLVWSEVGAAYRFDDNAVEEFTRQWMEIVRQNYSHPSIITWTPFNESWGIGNVKRDRQQQHFTEAVYHLTKSFDENRMVIVNDGWEHTVSDILTLHDYEESGEVFEERYTSQKSGILEGSVYHCGFRSAYAKGYTYGGQPVIISEYGGIAFNEEGGWGYGNKVNDREAFIKRFDSITSAIKHLPYVCGYCYTQITDVQQEINGLMTEDRQFKLEPEIIKKINDSIK